MTITLQFGNLVGTFDLLSSLSFDSNVTNVRMKIYYIVMESICNVFFGLWRLLLQC